MVPEIKNEIEIILINDERKYGLPEDFILQSNIHEIDNEECTIPGKYKANFGTLKGIYTIWKKCDAPYISINFRDKMPKITEESLEKLQSEEVNMILSYVYCGDSLQENYRRFLYGYDFRLMMTVLKKEYPKYYEHAKEDVRDEQKLIHLCGIFDKRIYDRFCAWMFPILKTCARVIPERKSKMQNMYLEHLSARLFTIYVSYWKEKYPYEMVPMGKLLIREEKKEIFTVTDPNRATLAEIKDYITEHLNNGAVEYVSQFARNFPKNREELQGIKEVFEEYEKERRYRKLTKLDNVSDWTELLQREKKDISPGILKGKPRLLIFEWNSVGHNVNVQAFRDFGFDCHTIRAPYQFGKFNEDTLEQLNRHLDFNQFDVVFSLNCIGVIAEACYIHDIPYIAWCYDAPTFVGAKWYLSYPTTHVFLFDSDDARHYKDAKIPNSYYLPLAVNIQYFDGIRGTADTIRKFSADVSFVGSLYDSTLPEAMGYLTDYQKAYLNALMDNQIDVYGHNFFQKILSMHFTEWLDQEDFNQLCNFAFDKDMEKSSKDVLNAGRLSILLNRQTTNKERILLLNLLAKYYEVKLYSYTNSEALKGLTFCGTADYYTEMPLIFRHSKINLNATLRSIQTGIPLRCLDIMGCHGLLLTNYQKDFDDHFVDEKNVLFYTDAEEALEKTRFYLEHESLRRKIEDQGYETVRKYYDYPVKLREMFEMANLEYLIPKEGI